MRRLVTFWLILYGGIALWELVPDSQPFLYAMMVVGIIGCLTYILIIASEESYDAEQRYCAEQKRREEEEREARMKAYAAVTALAEKGIDVRLPKGP